MSVAGVSNKNVVLKFLNNLNKKEIANLRYHHEKQIPIAPSYKYYEDGG